MPVADGVGHNRYSTPLKQEALQGISGHLIGAVAAVARDRQVRAVAIDMTCGPGMDAQGRDGSPLIFASHVDTVCRQVYPMDLVCIDRERGHVDALADRLAARFPSLSVSYATRQADVMRMVPSNAVGLAYFDPNGWDGLDIALLAEMGRHLRTVDILMTRGCLQRHRMEGWEKTRGHPSVLDYLRATGKTCFYIAQFADWDWWSFAFADNWRDRRAESLRWRNGRLYPIDSANGQRQLAEWEGRRRRPQCKQGEFSWEA